MFALPTAARVKNPINAGEDAAQQARNFHAFYADKRVERMISDSKSSHVEIAKNIGMAAFAAMGATALADLALVKISGTTVQYS